MTHLTLETDLTGQQRDYLGKVEISVKNLLGIIDDILDFSKIEAGKLEIENISFSLEDVLENLSSLLTPRAMSKGLEIVFNTDPAIPFSIKGDPVRLSQVLTNLLSNAIKFTDRGKVTLSCRLLSKDAGTVPPGVSDPGHRHRHQPGRAKAAVQGIFPGRRQHHQKIRGHRPGAGHQQAAGRPHGRRDMAAKRAGQGKHLRLHRFAKTQPGRKDKAVHTASHPARHAGAAGG